MSDLSANDLRPTGGTWSGLLFENPATDRPLALTWSFTVDFAEVARDYGTVAPALTVEWVPVGASSWVAMAGHRFNGTSFADPVESSVYFFQHHRFDRADVHVRSQTGDVIDLDVTIDGDLDRLGVPSVTARARLHFAGIHVQSPSTGTDARAASDLLARFTSVDGLRPRPRSHNVVFERTT